MTGTSNQAGNRDETRGVVSIMDAREDQDELAKVVVDEDYLNSPHITDSRIRILLSEAMAGQDDKVARMCTAAIESNNTTVRDLARRGCAELWNTRIVKIDARKQASSLPPAYRRYEEDPDDAALAVGDATSVIALISGTPVEVRSLGSGMGKVVTLTGGTQRVEMPPSPPPQLVEFPCPMCHRPIFGEDDGALFRVPIHRIGEPVFPFGLKHPPHVIRCPASGMEITQLCDGEHDAPECFDPQCWQLPTEQPTSFAEDVAEDHVPPPMNSFLPRPDEWDIDERTTIGYAYRAPDPVTPLTLTRAHLDALNRQDPTPGERAILAEAARDLEVRALDSKAIYATCVRINERRRDALSVAQGTPPRGGPRGR
jgi:hypothetical protein